MIHHDSVVEQAVRVLSAIIRDQEAEVYLVQNIYGRLAIYFDTKNSNLMDTAAKRLSDELGSWLQGCDSYDASQLCKSKIISGCSRSSSRIYIGQDNTEKRWFPARNQNW